MLFSEPGSNAMTDTTSTFLVIRPVDRWDRTREALAPLGAHLIFADVLTYIPTQMTLPPLTGIRGLIITSLRAVTSLKEIPDGLKTLPTFIVGAETARALRDLGFTGPQTVAPTGEALAPLITESSPAHQTYLYLRGSDVAVQFRKIIKNHVILEHHSYRGLPKSGLAEDIQTAIRNQKINGIMFFSRESTRAFCDMADRAGLIPNFSTLTALCLSPSVLGSLHPEYFSQTAIAPTPDLIGMGQVLRRHLEKDTTVTPSTPVSVDQDLSSNMIANADQVIERFGGIRPMANKLGVPVTTVQGWKKRGVIPANRAALIEQAAATHGVETTGLIHIISGDVTTRISLPQKPKTVDDVVAPAPDLDVTQKSDSVEIAVDDQTDITNPPVENVQDILDKIADAIHHDSETAVSHDRSGSDVIAPVAPAPEQTKPAPVIDTVREESPHVADPAVKPSATVSRFFNRRKTDKIARATWLAVIMLATAVIVGLIAMGPGVTRLKHQDAQLKILAADIDHLTQELTRLRDENALLSGLVPKDLKEKMSAIQTRAKNIESAVSDLGTQTKALTTGVLGSGDGSIEGRLSHVETTLGDVSKNFASEHLARFVVYIATLKQSPDGAEKIGSLVQALYGALPVDITPSGFNAAFGTAVKTNPDLSSSFANMTMDDQRQAALLLVLAHIQISSGQDRVSMDQDAQLLSLMIPDQHQILDDFSKFSKDGVRSTAGLLSDFEVMTDNVTTALIEDHDTSLTTRLWVQLHDKMRIERNGVALTGTTPQRILDRAKRAMATGDIAGAVNILQSLTGKSATIAGPWVKDAESTIQAQKTLDQLTKIISATISIDPASAAIIATLSPKSDIIDITKGMADSLGTGYNKEPTKGTPH